MNENLAIAAPAHFPSDPTHFNFDEVAPFFQNMAVRSIPLYEVAHSMHARMLAPWLKDRPAAVLDVGASRGRFFDHLVEQYGHKRIDDGTLDLTAIDKSLPMVSALRERYPTIGIRAQDIAADEFIEGEGAESYDVVCAFYVLQFIRPSRQAAVLRRLMTLVKPGGVLILGQKSAHHGVLADLAHDDYMRWREGNGYSRAEIEAKSLALQNSMWPMSDFDTRGILKEQMSEVFETTRIGVFNTLMARK